jgi:hypothetical protein
VWNNLESVPLSRSGLISRVKTPRKLLIIRQFLFWLQNVRKKDRGHTREETTTAVHGFAATFHTGSGARGAAPERHLRTSEKQSDPHPERV